MRMPMMNSMITDVCTCLVLQIKHTSATRNIVVLVTLQSDKYGFLCDLFLFYCVRHQHMNRAPVLLVSNLTCRLCLCISCLRFLDFVRCKFALAA